MSRNPFSPPFRMVFAATLLLAALAAATVSGQRGGAFRGPRDHPAIQYTDGLVDNVVAGLNARLEAGELDLRWEGRSGYLRSVLDAFDLPVESQLLVFSPTSFQSDYIEFDNPRAVYFADEVLLGWVRGAEVLEIAAFDRQQGSVFYSLAQTPEAEPRFERRETCLACHLSWDTLGVPGLQVMSMFPAPEGSERLRERPLRRSPEPPRGPMGRMVRHRHAWRLGAHGERRGGGCRRSGRDARRCPSGDRVDGGQVRPRRLPDALQRCRRASGARPSGPHDEPHNAGRLGVAPDRPPGGTGRTGGPGPIHRRRPFSGRSSKRRR